MRPFRTSVALLEAFLVVLALAHTVSAQDPEADELAALRQRLDTAERQLAEFESPQPPLDADQVLPTEMVRLPDSPAPDTDSAQLDASLFKRMEKFDEFITKYNASEAEKKAVAAKKPTFKIGGRIHLDYWGFPDTTEGIDYFENPGSGVDPEDRFQFRRIRLEIGGDIFDTMNYRLQVDFNNPSTPEYKDVYLGFKDLPHNQELLIGNQKRPLGLDHLNSSRFNVFAERPLVVEAFNEDARRLGIAMYGYTDDELYHWRYGVYNLENTSTTGRYVGDTLQLSANARLSSSPWYDEASEGRCYFHWAVAGMVAHPDGDFDPDDANGNEGRFRTRGETRSTNRWINTGAIDGARWYEIAAVEAMLNVGPLQIVSEYQSNWLQRDNHTPGTGPDVYFHGAYVYVAYFLTGEHMPYDRQSGTLDRVKPFENFFLADRCHECPGGGWGAWQVALRYSYLDLTDNDILGGREDNVTFDLNWYWTSHSKLQFNAVRGFISDHAPVAGFTDGNFTSLGVRLMVDF